MIYITDGPAIGCTFRVDRAPRLIRLVSERANGWRPLDKVADFVPYGAIVAVYVAYDPPVDLPGNTGWTIDYHHLADPTCTPSPNEAWQAWARENLSRILASRPAPEPVEEPAPEPYVDQSPAATYGMPDVDHDRRGGRPRKDAGGAGLFDPPSDHKAGDPPERGRGLNRKALQSLYRLRKGKATDDELLKVVGSGWGQTLFALRQAGFVIDACDYNRFTRKCSYILVKEPT